MNEQELMMMQQTQGMQPQQATPITTRDLLAQYRQIYGLEVAMNKPENKYQAPVQQEPATPFDEAQQLNKDAMNWGVTQGLINDGSNDNMNDQRLSDIESILRDSDFMQTHGADFEEMLDELRSAIEDPNSPIDEETAKQIYTNAFTEKFGGAVNV